MPLPFTPEQFLDGFGWFNTAAWPLHLAMFGVVVGIVVLAFRGGARASRTISVGLALLWLAAAVLQGTAFRGVMPTAIPFAVAFLLEAVLLAVAGVGDRLAFRVHRGPLPALGLALVCYAALLYPAIGALTGHTWPRVPVFGVAPCPNTIFTFGVLLLTERPVPRWLLPIPFLWSLIGIPAAAFLGIAEDWGFPSRASVRRPRSRCATACIGSPGTRDGGPAASPSRVVESPALRGGRTASRVRR